MGQTDGQTPREVALKKVKGNELGGKYFDLINFIYTPPPLSPKITHNKPECGMEDETLSSHVLSLNLCERKYIINSYGYSVI